MKKFGPFYWLPGLSFWSNIRANVRHLFGFLCIHVIVGKFATQLHPHLQYFNRDEDIRIGPWVGQLAFTSPKLVIMTHARNTFRFNR